MLHGKVDANQSIIVEALKAAGATVQSLADVGNGCPDLACGFRGQNYLLEVKAAKGNLNSLELSWHDNWNGAVTVVRTVDEALEAIGAI